MAKRAKPKSGRADATQTPAKSRPRKAPKPEFYGSDGVPSLSEPARPKAEAITALEEAIQMMRRGKFMEAADRFRALIEGFPSERPLLDSSRVYLERCQREVEKEQAPQTLEERMTAATAALNNDDEARAVALANDVLAEEPKHDLALYLLAAVHARRGQLDSALTYLGQAIRISPEAAAQARLDTDFGVLRGSLQFQQLTGA